MKNDHLARRLTCGLVLVLLAVVSCREQAAVSGPPAADVVARVGTEPITKADLEAELALRGQTDNPAARKQVLDEMIGFKRLILEGRSLGMHQDEESRRVLERSLAKRVRAAHEERLANIAAPEEADLRKTYEANLDSYRQPAAALGAILIRRGGTEESRALLAKALDNASLPEDGSFGSLAIDASDDQATRYRGGRMRWLSENQANTSQWPPEVFKSLFELETPGQVGKVVGFADGAFVVRLIEKRAGAPVPFEKAAADLRAIALKERRSAIELEFQQKMSSKYPAEFPQAAAP
jgi:hypothetical protein